MVLKEKIEEERERRRRGKREKERRKGKKEGKRRGKKKGKRSCEISCFEGKIFLNFFFFHFLGIKDYFGTGACIYSNCKLERQQTVRPSDHNGTSK